MANTENAAQPPKGKKDREIINPGSLLETICQLLGSGGFGDVYLVKNVKTNTVAAMKTERQGVEEGRQRLSLEVMILIGVTRLPEQKRAHFTRLITYGQNDMFKFFVMSLVGKTISDFQRQQKDNTFSVDLAVKISIQCLEGLSQLHELGFIHRDIKPNNFALGVGKQTGNVIILDFGIARRIVHKKLIDIPRKPREVVKFIGTLRYSSRNSLRMREQSRKDDLESLFYTIMEIFNIRSSFWWPEKDTYVVLTLKQKLFDGELTLMDKFPYEMTRFMQYVDKLDYYSNPNYAYLRTLLENILRGQGVTKEDEEEQQRRLIEQTILDITQETQDEDVSGNVKEKKSDTKKKSKVAKPKKSPIPVNEKSYFNSSKLAATQEND
ncbi:unnamed protein product [Bursaphelenchus okinawaensis]|uniref:Protein kinase domain-containing protein n=1 Tax=Bursaphelenchus okinawaensis TaxID=465554 RepID=A0A811KAC9_9BILA|nr:unnamed protein product [Bursaphelenchus okinawaensis]CAG9099474.1 unnamed protein product [Bursaphelenchus okinawaensis]